ncbi:MAG: hypothetical protein ABJA93_02620 [Sporichthyaceae bacterium]
MARNTVSRTLHDVGLAAWFGGSLMGAVGLNAAAGAVDDPAQRGRVVNEGWDRWTPLNAGAIGAHLLGGTAILVANRKRVAGQQGVAGMTALKTVLTGAALGVTAYSRILGRKVGSRKDMPVAAGTAPMAQTPDDVAKAQQQLKALQWAVPATTAAILAVNAYAGEQQRPSEVSKGMKGRARQLAHMS